MGGAATPRRTASAPFSGVAVRATYGPIDERGARLRFWTEWAYAEQAEAAFCAVMFQSGLGWVARKARAVFSMKREMGSIVDLLEMRSVLRAVSNLSKWRASCMKVVAMATGVPFSNSVYTERSIRLLTWSLASVCCLAAMSYSSCCSLGTMSFISVWR